MARLTLISRKETCIKFIVSCALAVLFGVFAFSSQAQAEEIDEADLQASSTSQVSIWRLYNQWSGEHLYTKNAAEYNSLGGSGWKQEGEAWVAPASSGTPVYRLYNPYSGDHHYTTDKSEYANLGKAGWKQEGAAWYSDDAKGVQVYRLYNPYVSIGTHHFTKDTTEYNYLSNHGWKKEGVAWYGCKTSEPTVHAFAVYSESSQSLDFYKRSGVPGTGEKFNGKTVTQTFVGIESLKGNAAWSGLYSNVKTVNIVDSGIQPQYMDYWFGIDATSSALASVNNLSKLDTSKATSMAGTFSAASKITSLDLTSWNTAKVEDMTNIFNGCSALKTLNVSSWNTAKVKYFGGAFSNCKALESLDVSGWNTSSAEVFASMFNNCSALTKLDVSAWSTAKVKYLYSMFNNCSKLQSLNLAGWNASVFNEIDYMFANCTSLTTIGDVTKWNTGNVSTANSVFWNCSKLQANCLGWKVSKVTQHSQFAYNATGVTQPSWA